MQTALRCMRRKGDTGTSLETLRPNMQILGAALTGVLTDMINVCVCICDTVFLVVNTQLN